MNRTISVTIAESDDSEKVVELPAEWVICDCCNGEGKSSAYLGAYTASEWAEQGEDFHRDYMEGFYDRACDSCKGTGKQLIPDIERCVEPDHGLALEWLHNQEKEDVLERSILRAEARLLGDYT